MSEIIKQGRWGLFFLILLGCTSATLHSEQQENFDFWRNKAKLNGEVLDELIFEPTAEAIERKANDMMKMADERFKKVVEIKKDERTFENTIVELEQISAYPSVVSSEIYLQMNTAIDKVIRDKAQEVTQKIQTWLVETSFRLDLYQAVKEYQDVSKNGKGLAGEDLRLYQQTLRDYKRKGFDLSSEKRDHYKQLEKRLNEIQDLYQANLRENVEVLKLTPSELTGLSEDLLKELPLVDGVYQIRPNIASQTSILMTHAKSEEVRKRVFLARNSVAKVKNLPLMTEMVKIRAEIASLLGYKNWVDYKTEILMAKNSENVAKLLNQLRTGLEKKFQSEISLLQKRKVKDVGAKAKINVWDVAYYENLVKQENYNIDMEQLRVFFPMEQTMKGMFEVYSRLFGIKILPISPNRPWHPEVLSFVVVDAKDERPLGTLYMDLYPREGKYDHFANFSVVLGRNLENKMRQLPVTSLICNFPSATGGKPSLLHYSDVETLFHEFGHALHVILSKVKYNRFSGTSVPQDFVEMPSQMLEEWVRSKAVLDIFAADYRDQSHKIDADLMKRLNEAENLFKGTFYRGQLAYGLMDQYMHTKIGANDVFNLQDVTNRVLSSVYLPYPKESAFVATFGHLAGGYDANYYGYIWSETISKDLADVFKKSPGGFLDSEVGMRLRHEIYEKGDARDVSESVKAFLGRDYTVDAFLRELGL